MTDSLREQMAVRLHEVIAQSGVGGFTPLNEIHPDSPNGRLLRALADELKRQMEWARRECVTSVDSFGAGNSWTDTSGPLTLAPDGWTPDA